jgi:hypothetical protein
MDYANTYKHLPALKAALKQKPVKVSSSSSSTTATTTAADAANNKSNSTTAAGDIELGAMSSSTATAASNNGSNGASSSGVSNSMHTNAVAVAGPLAQLESREKSALPR